MKAATVIGELALAPVAGYVATKAMEPVSAKLYELQSSQDRRREDAAWAGPPYRIAAGKTLGLLGLHPGDRALDKAGLAFHYGLAIGWAPVYALLRRLTGLRPAAAGLATGTAMSLIVDEGITPLAGFSAPNRAYPAATHLRGLAAHLVYGMAVATVTETAWDCATAARDRLHRNRWWSAGRPILRRRG
jgi:hypothetical protein